MAVISPTRGWPPTPSPLPGCSPLATGRNHGHSDSRWDSPTSRANRHGVVYPEGLHMSRETEERNIQCVRELFAATGSGDWKTAESMLSADFFVTEADTLPFAGVYRGPRALQKLFEIVMASAGVIGLDIHEITAGGDRAVALLDLLLEGMP